MPQRLHLSERLAALPPDLGLRDGIAGMISALVTVAYCISFSALIFQGPLISGLGMGLTALLVGSAIVGAIVALTTSLPPADAGPDTPAVAVMSVLAATVAAPLFAAGLGQPSVIANVMMAITLSTLISGAVFYLIGGLRLGQTLRFVPYPVIGGFLAASGLLMVVGAIEVATGRELESGLPPLTSGGLQLLVSLLVAGLLVAARLRFDSQFVLPAVFFALTALLHVVLALLPGIDRDAWFLSSGTGGSGWWPILAVAGGEIDWLVLAGAGVEIMAVAGVTAVALLLDVTSLEVARAQSADLDREYRSNGLANGVAALFGGVAGNLSLQASVLIEEAGGRTRLSGLVAAVTLLLVVVSGLDVASIVPTPVLAGLLVYLGLVILAQAFRAAPGERTWTDFVLTLLIMSVIVWFGYLVGVVAGLVGATLLFAVSYSRIGVVRRHLTRAELSSNVERSEAEAQALHNHGRAIHVFWLDGFIFFGSSNRVFEAIRKMIDNQREPNLRFVVLDCRGVAGFDSSALLSLKKLRNHADKARVTLVFAGMSAAVEATMKRAGFFAAGERHRAMQSRNEAIEWCEDELLKSLSIAPHAPGAFLDWLALQLGAGPDSGLVEHLERREIAAGTVLYEEGDPAESIDFVVSGRVAIVIRDSDGRLVRLKRMSGWTVVGEMGFFRSSPRAATVVAEEETLVYTLARERFEAMRQTSPALAIAFLEFIVRVLADRLDTANREVAALL